MKWGAIFSCADIKFVVFSSIESVEKQNDKVMGIRFQRFLEHLWLMRDTKTVTCLRLVQQMRQSIVRCLGLVRENCLQFRRLLRLHLLCWPDGYM